MPKNDFIGNEIPYNFNDVPTIKEFYSSNKRIRAIVGPFGCYVSDCEYLSFFNGRYQWKKIKDFRDGEKIAVYDLKTKELRFEEPLAYVKLPMRDDWVHIRGSRFFEAIVSPEHVFPYSMFHSDEDRTKTVSELIRWGITNARVVNTFYIRGDTFGLDEWLVRFIAMLSADGHKLSKSKWQVCLRKQRKIERLKYLCGELNIPYSHRICKSRPTENIFILDVSSYSQLAELTKKFPNYFYNLSSDLLDVLIDEILYWDGCFYNGNDRRYFTTIKENAEFIQYASHATGRRASILKISYPKDNWKDGYVVYISGKGNKKTCFIDKDAPKYKSIKYIPPKEGEFKYCFTTSTGFFLVRFNGAIYISGNSGKSSGCVITLLRHTCEQMPDPYGVRRTRFVIVRNVYRQLKDTTKKTIDRWLRFAEWKESEFKYNLRFKLPDNTIVESEWLLRALDRPEHIANLYSLEVTGAWINEAKEIAREVFDTLEGRLRYPPTVKDEDGNVIYGPTWLGILLDTNPPDTDHWFYKYFEEDRPEKAEIFHQPSGLSPEAENLRNLPENYYQELCIGKDPDWIDVYVHGKYGSVRMGKPVFSLYDDEVHCAEEPLAPIPAFPLILGMDFGLTPACVIVQKPPRRLLVLDEIVAEDAIDVLEFLTYMVLPFLDEIEYYRNKPFVIVGDPAGKARSQVDGRTVFQAIAQLGIRAYPAYTNSIQLRLNAVNQYLTRLDNFAGELRPAFLLSPTCKVLRQALKGKYVMKRISVGTDAYSDIPLKNKWSHVADALQYASLGYTPMNFSAEDDFSFSQESAITTLGGGIY